MFDTKAEIGLTFPDGKNILVRYPTDAEFTEWRRKKKIAQKDLGRGNFEIEPAVPAECDVALAKAIRLDNETGPDKEAGPAIDKFEAFYIIGQLADCEVSQRPERDGSMYTIHMKVMRKLPTTHTLRIPSVKEMMDYERMRSSVRFGQYGQQDIRINFSAAGDLYDKLLQSVEGYERGEVPVPHKAGAINVLLQEIRAEQEEAPESDDDQD